MTIENNCINELIINKSKFITYLYKINSKEDILKILTNLKQEYKDATHIVYAYILDNEVKYNDDNEPTGTSGFPILEVLKKNNLNHVICICIRYFGGIKLGAGGLIRAYSNSCSLAIKKTTIVALEEKYKIKITFSYDLTSKIDNLINQSNIIEKSYQDDITYYLIVNKNIKDKLALITKVEVLEKNYF